jgi:hypothetical protein
MTFTLREQMAIASLEEIQAGDSTQWIRVRGSGSATVTPRPLISRSGSGWMP